jgi:hypothetical protein
VDAVFVWGGNGKIYFMKDRLFWKFDPDAKPYVRCVKVYTYNDCAKDINDDILIHLY